MAFCVGLANRLNSNMLGGGIRLCLQNARSGVTARVRIQDMRLVNKSCVRNIGSTTQQAIQIYSCTLITKTKLFASQVGRSFFRNMASRNNQCVKNVHGSSFPVRLMSTNRKIDPKSSKNIKTLTIYLCASLIAMVGLTYASVPLYRIFCKRFGLGGYTADIEQYANKVESMEKVKDRVITVEFKADTDAQLKWNFRPAQNQIRLVPGETALAFYRAKNPTDKPVIGISTYNMIPFAAYQYFHKIQCFCFEEQLLNPGEEVDMPVFFYIDPDYDLDPELTGINQIILSYTFYEAKEGMKLPLPGFTKPSPPLKVPSTG